MSCLRASLPAPPLGRPPPSALLTLSTRCSAGSGACTTIATAQQDVRRGLRKMQVQLHAACSLLPRASRFTGWGLWQCNGCQQTLHAQGCLACLAISLHHKGLPVFLFGCQTVCRPPVDGCWDLSEPLCCEHARGCWHPLLAGPAALPQPPATTALGRRLAAGATTVKQTRPRHTWRGWALIGGRWSAWRGSAQRCSAGRWRSGRRCCWGS